MNEHDIILPLQQLTADQGDNLRQLVQVTACITSLYAAMEARVRALQDERSSVTILHKDALRITRAIREKAAAESERYRLDRAGALKLKAMIHKKTLQHYGIRNLHDLPQSRLTDCERYIESMACYTMAMKAREKACKT